MNTTRIINTDTENLTEPVILDLTQWLIEKSKENNAGRV